MSKFIGLLILCLTSVQAISQYIVYEICTSPPVIDEASYPIVLNRAIGDVIWVDDFSVASNWISTGPSTNYLQNGWSIGNQVIGFYFGGQGDMGTSGNFARFVNGDPSVPSQIDAGPFTLEYNSTIDLSGIVSPTLVFEQYGARFVTHQGIEVSTDNGVSWFEVFTNDNLLPFSLNTGAIYGKPETHEVNIAAEIANDPSNVKIRLMWDGMMNGGSMNYIEYGWFIDNIRIVEGANYDAKIQSAYFRSGVGGYFADGLEYYSIPQTQITNIELSGTVFNNGGQLHTGLMLETNVDNGGSVFSDNSSPVDLLSLNSDSLVASTDFVPPATIGPYQISWNFAGANPEEITTNDTLYDAISVTSSIYSRANATNTGYIDNIYPNDAVFQIGNIMEIFSFAIISEVEVQISGELSNEGELVYGTIYKYNSGVSQFELLAQSADVLVTSTNNGAILELPFTTPVEVQAGDVLLVCAGHYGGGGSVGFMMAQNTREQSVMGWVPQYSFFTLSSPRAIQVQLELSDYYITHQTEAICIGDSLVIGSNTYFTPGVYNDTLTAVNNGLDSVLVIELIVDSPYEGSQGIIICEGDELVVGNSVYTSPGTYTDTLVMYLGTCDSIVHTSLTTVPAPLPYISLFQDTITAIDVNATVQWVNCDSAFAEVPGATDHVFAPTLPGNYAAVLTLGGCVDTSLCAPVNVIGWEGNEHNDFNLYPNPASHSITIEARSGNLRGYKIQIVNCLGQVVTAPVEYRVNKIEVLVSHLKAGLYFVQLDAGKEIQVVKLIIE